WCLLGSRLLCGGLLFRAGRSLASRRFLALGRTSLFRNQRQRFFQCDTRRVFTLRQRSIDLAPVDIGPIATVTDRDRAAIWMVAQRRQRRWCGTAATAL